MLPHTRAYAAAFFIYAAGAVRHRASITAMVPRINHRAM